MLKSSSAFRFWLASTAIVWLALWIRLVNLYGLPVFVDEGNHLIWAQSFSTNNPVYPIFMDGKFLMGVLVALFHPLGPGPLWLGRAVIALFSIFSCAACIQIGKQLGSPAIGLSAGLLYAVLPQAVFFERQLLADPLMSAFGSLAIAMTLQSTKAGRRGLIAPLALSLAAATLAKFFGLVYLGFPVAAIIFLAQPWRERQQLAIRYGLAFMLAVVITGGFLLITSPLLGYNDRNLGSGGIGLISCPPLLCNGDLVAQLQSFYEFGRNWLDWMSSYFNWLLVILALLALPVSFSGRRKLCFFLLLPTLVALIPFAAATNGYFPNRYVIFVAVPLCALAAAAVRTLSLRAQMLWPDKARSSIIQFAVGGALLTMLVAGSTNSVAIAFKPQRAALPNLEYQGYFTASYSGEGLPQMAFAIQAHDTNEQTPPVVILTNVGYSSAAAYFDRTRVDVRAGNEFARVEIGRWLFNGQTIYLLDDVPVGEPAPPDPIPGLQTEEISRRLRQSTISEFRLRKIIGVDSQLRRDLFREFFIKPEKLVEDYLALANSLPQTGPLTLLVYPPTQLEALTPLLAGHSSITIRAVGDSWPLNVAEAESELLRLAAKNSEVRMVFLEETKGDPNRAIETWLNRHLFRLDEQWFGPVRVVSYAGDGAVAQTIPVGGQFGDALTLESVEVIDPAAHPGDVIRLRLIWRADSVGDQQLKIFTHIFVGEDIAAQHDGQPVGELRPTNTWQAGERVVDQFALRLSADIQPGEYQLRIGMYDINTQARLPLRLPDGSSGEFFVGGQIVVSK